MIPHKGKCSVSEGNAGVKRKKKDSGEAVSREFLESGQRDYAFCKPEENTWLCGWIFICISCNQQWRRYMRGILVSEFPIAAV